MKEPRRPLVYPFLSKRDVVIKLETDASFVRVAMGILHARFMDCDCLEPPAGWTASDTKRGEEVYARMTSPDATAADVMAAGALAKRYARQIASHLRLEAILHDPRLTGAAAVFGVRVPDELAERIDDEPYPADDEHEDGAAEDGAAGEADATTPAEAAVAVPVEASETTASDAVPSPPSPEAGTADAPPVRRRGRPKGSKNRPKTEALAKPKKRHRRS